MNERRRRERETNEETFGAKDGALGELELADDDVELDERERAVLSLGEDARDGGRGAVYRVFGVVWMRPHRARGGDEGQGTRDGAPRDDVDERRRRRRLQVVQRLLALDYRIEERHLLRARGDSRG